MIDTKAGRGILSVGMSPTFGTRCLLARMTSFQQLYPDLTVDIRISDGKLDFSQDRFDVAIRFGYGNWDEARCEPLMSEEMQVVCSPRIMVGPYPLTDNSQLNRHRLFMALQAVKSGFGTGLLPAYLCANDVASGSLITPFPVRVGGPGAYYLVTPWEKMELPRVRVFRQWVLAQM